MRINGSEILFKIKQLKIKSGLILLWSPKRKRKGLNTTVTSKTAFEVSVFLRKTETSQRSSGTLNDSKKYLKLKLWTPKNT
jgi:hypothetical protein